MARPGPPTRRRRAEADTILFIVTSFWAYGELMIALEFARRAQRGGYRPLFLAPPSHRDVLTRSGMAHTSLIPGSAKLNRVLLRDIEHVHRPALVILSDFMNFAFCERHYGLVRPDLDVFSGAVGTFDNFDWNRPFPMLDTYGFPAKHEGELSTEGFAFRLLPCPLNPPDSPTPSPSDDGIRYASIAPSEFPETSDCPRPARLPAGPVVLLTTATWQHTYAAYPRVHSFVEMSVALMEHLLRRVPDEATVVSVGPRLFFRDGGPENFVHVDQLPPDVFRAYLAHTDVFVSCNITSVTLHRVVLSGTSAVVLQNSYGVSGLPPGQLPFPLTDFTARQIKHAASLYPFRMFPVGWYHFLDSLMVDNAFTDAIQLRELFDVAGTSDTIADLIAGSDARYRLVENTLRYRDRLRGLSSPEDIVAHLIAQH